MEFGDGLAISSHTLHIFRLRLGDEKHLTLYGGLELDTSNHLINVSSHPAVGWYMYKPDNHYGSLAWKRFPHY